MSRAASSSAEVRYGVVRVTREGELARSSFYHRRARKQQPALPFQKHSDRARTHHQVSRGSPIEAPKSGQRTGRSKKIYGVNAVPKNLALGAVAKAARTKFARWGNCSTVLGRMMLPAVWWQRCGKSKVFWLPAKSQRG